MLNDGHEAAISLSVDETNKLRSKLGLPPLDISEPQRDEQSRDDDVVSSNNRKRKREQQQEEAEEGELILSAQATTDEVRERIERARVQRRIAEMMKLPEMDDEDDDLDVAAWTEKMRRQEQATNKGSTQREQPTWQTDHHHPVKGVTEMSMKLGHGLRLKEGESVTLTLADSHVLDSDAGGGPEIIIEDSRLKELERYKKNVKERKRIKEYMASAGPTGISGRAIEPDDSDDDDDGGEKEISGPVMPPDEAEGRSLMTDEDYNALADEHSISTSGANGVSKGANSASIKTVVVRTGGDSIESQHETDINVETEAPKSTLDDRKAKLKAKKEKLKKKKTIDWADVFGQDEDTVKEEAPSSSDVDTKPSEAIEPPVTVKSWGVVANDLEDDGEDEENTQFYGAIFRRMKTAPVEDVQVKDEETLKTLELLPKVKDEIDEAYSMADADHESGIQTSIGLIDEGIATVKPEMVITSTEEFAKSLQTPLERLEERKSYPSVAKKRGTEVETRKRTRADLDGKPITFQDIPEEILMEKAAILDEERIDSGLSSALQYIKKKGDLEEDKWKLGRVGKEQKKPLHKSVDADDVKLDYTDDYGNVMNPKQAFRYMSWSFHGKGPGKTKTEKMLKRMEIEHKLKTDDPSKVMPTLRALRAQQAKGEAYLVLSGGSQQQNARQ